VKSLVAYYSEFGNTRQIAETIAETLGKEGASIAMPIGQLQPSQLKGLDLLVMGSPTHRMNVPEAVRPILKSLPRGILAGTPVAAFDTSYKMSSLMARFSAGRKLAPRLRKLGGQPTVPPQTFHVESKEGPLCEGEIERAQAWAASILEQLKAQAR